jgi:hypothetical protein
MGCLAQPLLHTDKAPDAGNRVIARYTRPVQNEISSKIEV